MKNLLGRFAFILVCLGMGSSCLADSDYPPPIANWSGKSPDGRYVAATREIPYSVLPERRDLDTEIVSIARLREGALRPWLHFQVFRLNAYASWSPDSRFLVMTTDSAGGHSPWHFETFVFSVSDGTLRQVDPITRPVVRPDFTFVGSDQVRLAVWTPGENFDSPKWIIVDLAKKFHDMPKLEQPN
jgi:hypothetical protein